MIRLIWANLFPKEQADFLNLRSKLYDQPQQFDEFCLSGIGVPSVNMGPCHLCYSDRFILENLDPFSRIPGHDWLMLKYRQITTKHLC